MIQHNVTENDDSYMLGNEERIATTGSEYLTYWSTAVDWMEP